MTKVVLQVCFSLNANPKAGVNSDETMRWHNLMVESCHGGFHDISAAAFSDGAVQINDHRPHVLINLDGWTSAPLINEIFMLQPAPVQVDPGLLRVFSGFFQTMCHQSDNTGAFLTGKFQGLSRNDRCGRDSWSSVR